jgi:hypothetical protein
MAIPKKWELKAKQAFLDTHLDIAWYRGKSQVTGIENL